MALTTVTSRLQTERSLWPVPEYCPPQAESTGLMLILTEKEAAESTAKLQHRGTGSDESLSLGRQEMKKEEVELPSGQDEQV